LKTKAFEEATMMKLLALGGLTLGILMSCATWPTATERQIMALTSSDQPAWGERIEVSTPKARVVTASGTQNFSLSSKIFDLPAPPIVSTEAYTSTITTAIYHTPLEPAAYINRGRIETLTPNNTVVEKIYPFGSVIGSEIVVLVSLKESSCNDFFTFLNDQISKFDKSLEFGIERTSLITALVSENLTLCFAKIMVGQQSTYKAIQKLKTVLENYSFGYSPEIPSGYVVDKNTIYGLNQESGVWAYDPTCSEIKGKLDPTGNVGYTLVDQSQLRTDIGLTAVAAGTPGQGVRVTIIGGGVGAQDQFNCAPYDFKDHDTHVRSIIQTIAPSAEFTSLKACDSSGKCETDDLSMALMQVFSFDPKKPNVLNMSLGGPLPNKVLFHLMRLLGSKRKVFVITSGGNTPNAPVQYPASYSSGVTNPGLINVISVAAVGLNGGTYQIAGFNTRDNADVFAPGVNMCPPTANTTNGTTGIARCNGAAPFPDNIGLTGSSFAAPVLVGLAALYVDTNNDQIPAQFRTCLTKTALPPSGGDVKIVQFSGAC
jgi:Subtilase family